MELYICLTIVSWIGQSLQAKDCERGGQAECCSGYRWNKAIGRCDKCPVGYTGINCIYQCNYPSYGEDCAKGCQCPQEQCDYVFGCPHTTQAECSIVQLGRRCSDFGIVSTVFVVEGRISVEREKRHNIFLNKNIEFSEENY
uniref:Cell death abnormality protein 1-like n=1 Tax=Crassostrea virginica TaxID=6565 RepID=A0A8B8AUK4_CRAVI|nr:cell death abnormality protein 1-like [Crassostrea virginica]